MMKTRFLIAGCEASDAGAVVKEVDLPRGYYRVWEGALKPGDLYFNLKSERWDAVALPTLRQIDDDEPYSSVSWFGCIVRVGVPVKEACQLCGCAPRMLKNKYCRHCCREVILNHRTFSN